MARLTKVARLFVSAVASMVLWPCATHAQVQLDPNPSPLADEGGSYEPRIIAQPYRYDITPTTGLGSASSGDYNILGMHRFEAVAGQDAIRTITVAFSNASANLDPNARIAIWQGAPDGSFVPGPPLRVQTIAAAPNTTVVTDLNPPVPVTGTFYVAFTAIDTGPSFTLAMGTSTNPTAGRVFFGLTSNRTPVILSTFNSWTDANGPFPGLAFVLRATGSNGIVTYQGRLDSQDQPFTGQADFRVRLFNADGSPLTSALTFPDISVNQGLFTLPIPIEPATVASLPNYPLLEIGVRTPAGSGSFVTLSPRQRLTATPFALQASRADLADTAETAQSVPYANITSAPWTIASDRVTTTLPTRIGNGGLGFFLDVASPANAGNLANFTSLAPETIVAFTNSSGPPNPNYSVVVAGPSGTIIPPMSFALRDVGAGSNRLLLTSDGSATLNGSLTVEASVISAPPTALTIRHRSATPWPIRIDNPATTGFRGGARLSDAGFLEVTNRAQLANANFARLDGNGNWASVSDARLKTNVRPAASLLNAALALQPVTYHWLSDPSGPEHLGLIAQDVQRHVPSLVTGGETLTLDYARLSVVTLGAVQELARENRELRARLEQLEQQLANIRTPAPTTKP